MVDDTTDQADTTTRELTFGRAVYDDDGTMLGRIRGFDEHGFYVTAGDEVRMSDDAPPGEHTAASGGSAELMWRCWSCGEVGRIAELPEECPACGAPKEDLYYWTED